jgi:hypothetical protein
MPTRRAIALLLSGALLTVSGRYLALAELGTVGVALLVLVVASCFLIVAQVLRVRHRLHFTLTRSVPQQIFANEPFPVTLRAEARSSFLPLCRVEETVRPPSKISGSFQGGSSSRAAKYGFSAERSSNAKSDDETSGQRSKILMNLCRTGDFSYPMSFVRGLHQLGPTTMTLNDSLGLAYFRLGAVSESTVTVWPQIERLDEGTLDYMLSTASVPNETEPGDLREYVIGDDLRRVHWATSARASTLMVRGEDQPITTAESRRVTLDVSGSSHTRSSFELAVSVTASLLASSISNTLIDLCLDGPSGPVLYTGFTDSMMALSQVRPDATSTQSSPLHESTLKNGVVICGPFSEIPNYVRIPVLRCGPNAISNHAVSPDGIARDATSYDASTSADVLYEFTNNHFVVGIQSLQQLRHVVQDNLQIDMSSRPFLRAGR